MRQIIKRPFITEKSTIQNASGVYVFEVDLTATKEEVRTAVEKSFGVKVDGVRTLRGWKKQSVQIWKKALFLTGKKLL